MASPDMATQHETYQNEVARLSIGFFGRAPNTESMNHEVNALSHGDMIQALCMA